MSEMTLLVEWGKTFPDLVLHGIAILSVVWLFYLALTAGRVRHRQLVLAVGSSVLVVVIGVYVLSQLIGLAGSPESMVVRYSSLESPERIPPSVGLFQKWEEGTEWGTASAEALGVGAWLVLLTILGWIGFFLSGVRDTIGLMLRLRHTRSLEPTRASETHAIAQRIGLAQSFRLRVAAGSESPYACGVLRPTVVLNDSLLAEAEADPSAFRAALAHELTHVHQRDVFWQELIRFVQATFWYLPLVWPLRRCYADGAEQICDAAAIPESGGVCEYGRLLARIALENAGYRPNAHCASMAPVARVRRRIASLSSLSGVTGRVSALFRYGTFLMGLIAGVGLTGSVAGFNSERDAVGTQSDLDWVAELRAEPPQGSELAMDSVLADLQASEWQKRKRAAMTVAQWGVDASELHDPLVRAVVDSEWQVRQAAAYALLTVGVQASAQAVLETALTDPEWHVRKPAAMALGSLGAEAIESVPALAALLDDPEWYVRWAAVVALGKIEPDSGRLAELLEPFLEDEERQIRQAVRRLLEGED